MYTELVVTHNVHSESYLSELASLLFQILRLGGIAYFLSRLMDPPSREAVMLSINHLMELVN